MDHDPERAAELLGKREDRDAVADPVGMVRHDDQRAVRQVDRRPLPVAAQRDVDQVQHSGEDRIAARDDPLAPDGIEPRIAVATGQTLDRPYEPALERRLRGACIGQFGKERRAAAKSHHHPRWMAGFHDRDMKTAQRCEKGGDASAFLMHSYRGPDDAGHASAASRCRSGGTASAERRATASSSASDSWSREPRRRMFTVSSSASRLPHTRMTGTLARLCSRTL